MSRLSSSLTQLLERQTGRESNAKVSRYGSQSNDRCGGNPTRCSTPTFVPFLLVLPGWLSTNSARATTLTGDYVEVNYDEYGLPFDPDIPQGVRAYIGSTPAWYEFTFFDTTGTISDIDPFAAMSVYYEKGGTTYEYAGYAYDTTTVAEVDWAVPTETDLSTGSENAISWNWTAGDLEITKTERWDVDSYAIFVHLAVTNTSGSRLKNFSYLQLLDPADTRTSASSTKTRNDVMDLDGDGVDEWAQALGRSTTTSTNNRTIGYGFCDPSSQQVAFKDGVDVYISDVESTGFETDPGGSSSNTQLTYLYSNPSSIEAGDTVMFGMIVAMGTNSAGAQDAYSGALENCYDLDGDGYENDLGAGDDCNDSDADVNPDADEIWYDGYDQDCGKDDDYDQDGDGYVPDEYEGLKTYNTGTNTAISGTGTAPAGDCDDTDEDVYPGAEEEWYDGLDEDCQGDNDYDQDGDGYVEDDYEGLPTYDPGTGDVVDDGTGVDGGDCDDTDNSIYTGADEIWYDGLDEDCQGDDDYDQDGDGYVPDAYEGLKTYNTGTATAITGTGEAPAGDCDDEDGDVSPGAEEEWYDGIDQDCQGNSDYDQDGDGYVPDEYVGMPTYTTDGAPIDGTGEAAGGDCDDQNADTNPDSVEIWYDGRDEDCQGDDDYDQDGDGYVPDEYEGLPTTDTDGNEIPGTGELDGGDCDDENADIHPGAADDPLDDTDSDCDGATIIDLDGDGHMSQALGGDDCNDDDVTIFSGATDIWYDGVDSDCSGNDDYDQDEDHYVFAQFAGLPTYQSHTNHTVEVPGTGTAEGSECDDTNPSVPADQPCVETRQIPDATCGCSNSTSKLTSFSTLILSVLVTLSRRRLTSKPPRWRLHKFLLPFVSLLLLSPDAFAGYADDEDRSPEELMLFTTIVAADVDIDEYIDLWSRDYDTEADDLTANSPWLSSDFPPPLLNSTADNGAALLLSETLSSSSFTGDTISCEQAFCVISSSDNDCVVLWNRENFDATAITTNMMQNTVTSGIIWGRGEAPFGIAILPLASTDAVESARSRAPTILGEEANPVASSGWLIAVSRSPDPFLSLYAPLRAAYCTYGFERDGECYGVWYGDMNHDSPPAVLELATTHRHHLIYRLFDDDGKDLPEKGNSFLFSMNPPSNLKGACDPYWFTWETHDGLTGTFPTDGAFVSTDCTQSSEIWRERPIAAAVGCNAADDGRAGGLCALAVGLVPMWSRRSSRSHRVGNGSTSSRPCSRSGPTQVVTANVSLPVCTWLQTWHRLVHWLTAVSHRASRHGAMIVAISIVNGWLSLSHAADDSSQASTTSTRRVALVIGNSTYSSAAQLPGVKWDTEVVAGSLRLSGFDVITEENLDHSSFLTALTDLKARAESSDILLIYYSGHGIQYKEENYLVPVDARLADAGALRAQAISLTQVVGAMAEAKARKNIVILDACRRNPWASQWSDEDKAASPVGLGAVDVRPSFLIAFSTAPGQVALDGGRLHAGPYAAALAEQITAGANQLEVFNSVSLAVRRATKEQQQPWFSTNGQEKFTFDIGRMLKENATARGDWVRTSRWILSGSAGIGLGIANGVPMDAYIDGENYRELAWHYLGNVGGSLELGKRMTSFNVRLSVAPSLNGPFIYSSGGFERYTYVCLNSRIGIGLRDNDRRWGMEMGYDFPGRYPIRLYYQFGIRLPTRVSLGVNRTTIGLIEPAVEVQSEFGLFSTRL